MQEHPLVEVRDSPIHNKGLFAKVPITAGTNIVEYDGEKISKEEGDRRADEQDEGEGPILIFELDDEWDVDGSKSVGIAKYANHSCEGNAEVEVDEGKIWIRALKDIQQGEEILYDYNFSADAGDHECHCAAPNCRGTINQEPDEDEEIEIAVGDNVLVSLDGQEIFGVVEDLDEETEQVTIKNEETGGTMTVPLEVVDLVEQEDDEDDEDDDEESDETHQPEVSQSSNPY